MYRTDTEHTLTAGLGIADLSIPGWVRTTDGTPLVARCLVLDDTATRLAIVSLTHIGLRRAEAMLVRDAVAAASDIPAEHVMVTSTHVHGGPPVYTADQHAHRANTKAVVSASASAARQAADVQPARLGIAADHLPGISRVRRVLRRDGSVVTLRRAWPQYWGWAADPETIGPEEPLDDLLTVLRIDGQCGEPIGVLFHFTSHPIPDFLGDAAERVENALPGVVCPILNGCLGSVDTPFEIPIEGRTQNEQLPILGRTLADRILELAHGAETTTTARLGVCSHPVFLPLDQRVPESTAWRDAAMWEEALEAGGFATEVQCMRIGDLALAGIPGEAQVGFGRQIESVSPFSLTRGVGLANDKCGYLVSEDSRSRGGYEADPEIWGVVSGEGLPRILGAIAQCLRDLDSKDRR